MSISKSNESKGGGLDEEDNYPDQQNPFNDLDDFSDEDDPKNNIKIISTVASISVPLVETNTKKDIKPLAKTIAPRAFNENEHDSKVKEATVIVNNEIENEYENFNKLTIPPPLPILPPPSLDNYDNIINRDLSKDVSTNYDNITITINDNKVSDFFLTENELLNENDKKTNIRNFLDKKLTLREEVSRDCIYQNLKVNENEFRFQKNKFKWVFFLINNLAFLWFLVNKINFRMNF